jgi:hypothetical protein
LRELSRSYEERARDEMLFLVEPEAVVDYEVNSSTAWILSQEKKPTSGKFA